jgi:regulator of RNase E activity RraA
MSDSYVARLRRLDACAVSDACDRLGLEGRVADSLGPVTGPGCVAGRVITVELGPWTAAPSPEGPRRHLCAAATDASTADDVIVVDHQGRTDCAGWGGNLSRAAQVQGAAATLVDGAVRDVDEAIAIGYPVWATAVTPRTARGRTQEQAWGGSVTIDGVPVDQGDYVIADSTGVVFVTGDDIGAVLDAAETIARTEAAMAARIAEGQPVSAVLGADYESMLE